MKRRRKQTLSLMCGIALMATEMLTMTSPQGTVNAETTTTTEYSVELTEQGQAFVDAAWEPEVITDYTSASAADMVAALGAGWSMGNRLDAHSSTTTSYEIALAAGTTTAQTAVEYYETSWGNAKMSAEYMQCLKDEGIDTLRIPLTCYDYIDENGVIDSTYLDRVAEVADYAIDAGMYVIVAVEHDTDINDNICWIYSDADNAEENETNFENIWSQIATRFASYDERVLFDASSNMMKAKNTWSEELYYNDYAQIHNMNQVFIEAVRNAGGENTDRFLVINTYGSTAGYLTTDGYGSTALDKCMGSGYTDTASDRLILGVHMYDSAIAASNMALLVQKVTESAASYNIPVVFDEFALNDGSYDTAEAVEIIESAEQTANANGIACIWWDNGKLLENYDTTSGDIYGIAKFIETEVETEPENLGDLQYNLYDYNDDIVYTAGDGEVCGVAGGTTQIEGFSATLTDLPGVSLTYCAHSQTEGWLTNVTEGVMAGISGGTKRLEAIRILLEGSNAANYHVYYRVYCDGYGWYGWAHDGQTAGGVGYSQNVRAIQVKIVSASDTETITSLDTTMHCREWPDIASSVYSGTSNTWTDLEGLLDIGEERIEQFKLMTKWVENVSISYRSHSQTTGWESSYRDAGEVSGVQGKRLEAIEIKLTGTRAEEWDLYYRVYTQNNGWMGWAGSGQSAGSIGCSDPIMKIEVLTVPAGTTVDLDRTNVFISR